MYVEEFYVNWLKIPLEIVLISVRNSKLGLFHVYACVHTACFFHLCFSGSFKWYDFVCQMCFRARLLWALRGEFFSLPSPLIQSQNKKANILCHISLLVGGHFLFYSIIKGVILQKSWFYVTVSGPTSHLVWAKDFLFSSSLFIKLKSSRQPSSKWQLTLWFQPSLHFLTSWRVSYILSSISRCFTLEYISSYLVYSVIGV